LRHAAAAGPQAPRPEVEVSVQARAARSGPDQRAEPTQEGVRHPGRALVPGPIEGTAPVGAVARANRTQGVLSAAGRLAPDPRPSFRPARQPKAALDAVRLRALARRISGRRPAVTSRRMVRTIRDLPG